VPSLSCLACNAPSCLTGSSTACCLQLRRPQRLRRHATVDCLACVRLGSLNATEPTGRQQRVSREALTAARAANGATATASRNAQRGHARCRRAVPARAQCAQGSFDRCACRMVDGAWSEQIVTETAGVRSSQDKGRLNWVGHSQSSEWIRMIHHRSGHRSNTPVNNFGPHSFYTILYPTCDGTVRIPGVTNPVESTGYPCSSRTENWDFTPAARDGQYPDSRSPCSSLFYFAQNSHSIWALRCSLIHTAAAGGTRTNLASI
jgi:hypothetical protein